MATPRGHRDALDVAALIRDDVELSASLRLDASTVPTVGTAFHIERDERNQPTVFVVDNERADGRGLTAKA